MEFPKHLISKRLKIIANKINKHDKFADIGSDHGYLPCYICSRDKTIHAIIGEINTGPLKNAQKNILKYHLENNVETRQGSGLNILKPSDQINKIVIAGMGGKLIKAILKEDLSKISNDMMLILQPNNNEPELRTFLFEHQFKIVDESILADNKVIYEVIIAQKSEQLVAHSKNDVLFGPCLRKNKSDTFFTKWNNELQHLKFILNQIKKSSAINQKRINKYSDLIKQIEEEI